MDDLISRKAAINAIGNVPDYDDGMVFEALSHAQRDVALLPSAQPERLTDDDFEIIRIHLSAFKESLCNQRRWKEAEEYQRIIDRFMSFASAQETITYRLCADSLLKMWIDKVVTDGEYNRIMDKLNTWEMKRREGGTG